MTQGLFIIVQAFLANTVLVLPLGVFLKDHLDDVMVGMLEKNHQIVFQRFLANRANITFHHEPFSGGDLRTDRLKGIA